MVFPIVLGEGKRLFAQAQEAQALRLLDANTVGAGVVILTYEPARSSPQ
jgi:hypothetical protein